MADLKAKLAVALDQLLASTDVSDASARQAKYQRARELMAPTIARIAGQSGSDAAERARVALDDAIAEKEAEFDRRFGPSTGFDPAALPPPEYGDPADDPSASLAAAVPRPSPRNGRVLAAGFLGGMTAAGVLIAGLYAGGYLQPANGLAAFAGGQTAIAEADYAMAKPIADAAVVALREIYSRVEKAGVANLPELAEANGSVPASKLFPDYFQTIPEDVRKTSWFVVRSEGAGLKVLVSSVVCPLVAQSHPEMVDRSKTSFGPLCYQFGLWNEEGKDL